ncbi:uncharacterized protein LOC143295972 isoform X2 [Babylonia areolata]|uniref:uncharacterized protein LOC143295972 isoform X2 n=1 Tax=Babylonia areolata TaxID=304850 RepID=UPI003FD25977
MTAIIDEVPLQAVVFLAVVAIFLILLLTFALYLNRLLCFTNTGGFPCIDRIPHASRAAESFSTTTLTTDDTPTAGSEDDTSSGESDVEVLQRYHRLHRKPSGSTTYSLPRSGSDRSTASRTTVATVTEAPAAIPVATTTATTTAATAASAPAAVATTTTVTTSAATIATAAVNGTIESVVQSAECKADMARGKESAEERSSPAEDKQAQDSISMAEEKSDLPAVDYKYIGETPKSTHHSASHTSNGLESNQNSVSQSHQDLKSCDTTDGQSPHELGSRGTPVKQSPQESEPRQSTVLQPQQELEAHTMVSQSPQGIGPRDISVSRPVSQLSQRLESHDTAGSQSPQRKESPLALPPPGGPCDEVGGSRVERMEAGGQDYEESVNGQVGSVTYDNQAFLPELTDSATLASFSAHEHALFPASDEHLFDVSDLQHEPPLISKCGSLEVTFTYLAVRGRMTVHVQRAREIPTKDRGGANSTQVRLMLLPTKKQRFKTKVKEGEEPVFDETFVFSKIFTDELEGLGVRFRLYGLERMRREYMIGESIIGFASLNLAEPSTHWVILEPRSNLSHGDSGFDVSSLSRSSSASSMQSLQHGGMPELLVGLAYHSTTGRLAVQVVKGSNFRNMATNRPPDTYVKVTLMSSSGQEVQSCKTSIRRGQPNPLFKETFMMQVAQFMLPDVTLMVSVYNKKSMKKKEMIGWFSLGQNSSGEEEGCHWADMRESKGDEVCRWHVLLES